MILVQLAPMANSEPNESGRPEFLDWLSWGFSKLQSFKGESQRAILGDRNPSSLYGAAKD
jgi:hypothetical protein